MQIGQHQFDSRVFLAPMAGFTDLPTRQLCQQFDIAASVAEMVHADTGLWDTQKSQNRLLFDGIKGPKILQIVGHDPQQMAQAASMAESLGVDIVDINMGCPTKKVCKKAAGSALMQDEKKVAAILDAVVKAVTIPVTLKTRTGPCSENKNVLAIAKIAEDAGIQAITIHGRTRACRFNGKAEFDTIAEVKQNIAIPMIANGDIDSAEKACTVLEHTAADAVMIGRAIQGQPWILKEIAHFLSSGDIVTPLSQNHKKTLFLSHLTALHRFYGEYMGVRIARKHIGAFLDRENQLLMRKQFNQLEHTTAQLDFIHRYFELSQTGDIAA